MSRIPTLLVFVTVLAASQKAWAEPWIRDMRESNAPELLEIAKFDLEFQPPGTADQKRADALYIKYIQDHPESELTPYLYYRLGHLWTSRVTPPHQEAGAVRDSERAQRYFQLGVDRYPKDKLGDVLLDCHVNVAALSSSPAEEVQAYKKYYKLLQTIEAMPEGELREKVWLSSREKAILEARPDYRDKQWKAFRQGLAAKKEVAAGNMGSAAMRCPPEIRLDLLKDIVTAFPDDKPGAMARAHLREFGDSLARRMGDDAINSNVLLSPPEQSQSAATRSARPGVRPAGEGEREGVRPDEPGLSSHLWTWVGIAAGLAVILAAMWWIRKKRSVG